MDDCKFLNYQHDLGNTDQTTAKGQTTHDKLSLSIQSNSEGTGLLKMESVYSSADDVDLFYSVSLDDTESIINLVLPEMTLGIKEPEGSELPNNNLRYKICAWYKECLSDEEREYLDEDLVIEKLDVCNHFCKCLCMTLTMFYLIEFFSDTEKNTFFPFNLRLDHNEGMYNCLNQGLVLGLKTIYGVYQCIPSDRIGKDLFKYFNKFYMFYHSLLGIVYNISENTGDKINVALSRYMGSVYDGLQDKVKAFHQTIDDGMDTVNHKLEEICKVSDEVHLILENVKIRVDQMSDEAVLNLKEATDKAIKEVEESKLSHELYIQSVSDKSVSEMNKEAAKIMVELDNKKVCCQTDLDKLVGKIEEIGDDKIIVICEKFDDFLALSEDLNQKYVNEIEEVKNLFSIKQKDISDEISRLTDQVSNKITASKISALNELVKASKASISGFYSTSNQVIKQLKDSPSKVTREASPNNITPEAKKELKINIDYLNTKIEKLSQRLDSFIELNSI